MPKELGTLTLNLELVRSIQSFSVTIGPPDYIDVTPVIERRDVDTDELVETRPASPHRFSEEQMRAILDAPEPTITELPDYDTLRLGLSKLMHALIG